jgi:hypothetical protein
MTASRPAASLPHGHRYILLGTYVFDPAEIDADIAILGVPFDGMASMRPAVVRPQGTTESIPEHSPPSHS